MDTPFDRPVVHDDFNKLNDVAIFMGPIMGSFRTVTAKELKTLIDRGEDIVVLGAIGEEEFNKGHIPCSINVPVSRIEDTAPGLLGLDSLVITYSAGPDSAESAVAADKLATLGFGQVMRFTGGLDEWKKAGYRLDAGPERLKKAA